MTTRMPPRLPVHAYKTWEIAMPLSTHWRAASCEEVDCRHYQEGWQSKVDETTDLGAAQAYYIRRNSGRGFREQFDEDGFTVFVFYPGQRCFREHQKMLDRPQLHAVRGGDWRGRVGDRRIYDRPDQWRDDLASQFDVLRRAQE